MWLGLYQSASIWLVLALPRSATHSSIVAAGADRRPAHRQQDRGGRGEDDQGDGQRARASDHDLVSRAAPLAKSPQLDRSRRPCCAPTAPTATEASSKPSRDDPAEGATWIDLEEPTQRRRSIRRAGCIGLNVPTQQELEEIEPSSRLYERDGALYMTLSVAARHQGGRADTTPIGFVLADNRLVTVRYATPKPVLAFADHVRREPELARDAHDRAGPAARCDHRPAGRRARGRRARRSRRSRTGSSAARWTNGASPPPG